MKQQWAYSGKLNGMDVGIDCQLQFGLQLIFEYILNSMWPSF